MFKGKEDNDMSKTPVTDSETKLNINKLRTAGRVESLKSEDGIILLDRKNPEHRALFEED